MKKQLGKIQLPKAGKKSSLGVAIDDHMLMYVEVLGTTKGFSVVRFGEVPLETESVDTENHTAELTRVFSALKRRSKTKNIQVALRDSSATFFEMTLAESDPFLLEHMVEREVKKAIGDRQNFVLQTEILYREKNDTKVAVTMLPQEPIDQIKEVTKIAKWTLDYIGLATEITAEHLGLDDSASIVIAIKARETSITILSKGSLVLEEIVQTGTDMWIEKIMDTYGVDYENAVDALFFEGIGAVSNNGVTASLKNELRKIIDSAEKTFLYWHVDCRKEKECRVHRVTLVGVGASIPGIANYLETSLTIETKTPQAFAGLKLINDIPEMTESESLNYLPALALALRGFRK